MRRHPLRTLGLGTAALALLAVLPACGGNSDEGKVREAVSEYLDEVGEQDYQGACGYLHNDARSKLGGDCAGALKQRYSSLSADVRSDLDDIDVDDVTIKGSTATVQDGEIRVESQDQDEDQLQHRTGPHRRRRLHAEEVRRRLADRRRRVAAGPGATRPSTTWRR
jgi:hypothetical protein